MNKDFIVSRISVEYSLDQMEKIADTVKSLPVLETNLFKMTGEELKEHSRIFDLYEQEQQDLIIAIINCLPVPVYTKYRKIMDNITVRQLLGGRTIGEVAKEEREA